MFPTLLVLKISSKNKFYFKLQKKKTSFFKKKKHLSNSKCK